MSGMPNLCLSRSEPRCAPPAPRPGSGQQVAPPPAGAGQPLHAGEGRDQDQPARLPRPASAPQRGQVLPARLPRPATSQVLNIIGKSLVSSLRCSLLLTAPPTPRHSSQARPSTSQPAFPGLQYSQQPSPQVHLLTQGKILCNKLLGNRFLIAFTQLQ